MKARIRSRIGPKYWSSSSWPLGDAAPNRVRPVRTRSGRCSASRRSTRKYSCSGPMLVKTRVARRVAEPAQDPQGLGAEGLLRAQERDLVVERLAGVRHEGGRDRHRDAVGLDLEEDRAGDVPGGVAARLEGGPDAARREGAGVRLALEQVLAGELGDRPAVAGRVQERVVLLGGRAGHRHEPVGVVGGAVRHRPLLHAVGDRVHDGRVERLVAVDRPAQLLEDRLGQELALGVLVEDVLAVDLLAGELEVVLGGGDLVAGDGGDGGLTCGHGSPVGACGRRDVPVSAIRTNPAVASVVGPGYGTSPRGLRFSTLRQASSCASCTSRTASSEREPQLRIGQVPAADRLEPRAPGRRPCCGGPRGGPRRRRCAAVSSTARSVASRSRWAAGPADEDRREQVARLAQAVGQVVQVAQQQVGRQPGRAEHRRGGSRALPASSVSRAAASAAGRARPRRTGVRRRPGDRGTRPRSSRSRGHPGRRPAWPPTSRSSRLSAVPRSVDPRWRAAAGAGAARTASRDCDGVRSRRRPGRPAGRPTAGRPPAAGRPAGSPRGPGGRHRARASSSARRRHDPFAGDPLALVGRIRPEQDEGAAAGRLVGRRRDLHPQSATFDGRAR